MAKGGLGCRSKEKNAYIRRISSSKLRAVCSCTASTLPAPYSLFLELLVSPRFDDSQWFWNELSAFDGGQVFGNEPSAFDGC